MKIQVINNSNYNLPTHKTDGSAGIDLQANIDASIELKPFNRVLVPTGLFMSIPNGYEGQIRGRSGLALKHGITLANGIGTIDSDYRGEIQVILVNLGDESYIINPGDRIAQFVLSKYERVDFQVIDNLENTKRSDGGFGHTGIK